MHSRRSLPPASFRLIGAVGLLSLLCLSSLGNKGLPGTPAALPTDGSPQLAVLLVFDQMRADYLVRWRSLFEEGGFRHLQTEGAWFQNCHYPYAGTMTAAGHASLAAGCSPATHGIVGNEWYDRQAGKVISAVQTDRYTCVLSEPSAEPATATNGASPSTAGSDPERRPQAGNLR